MNTGIKFAVLATLTAFVCLSALAAPALVPAAASPAAASGAVSASLGVEDSTGIFPLDTVTTSPLTIDPTFNTSHLKFTANGGASTDHGFRVFSRVGGYFLVGYHTDGGSSPYQAFIWNLPLNGNGGTLGTVNLPFYPVDVVRLPGQTKFYFTGAYKLPLEADYDFAVYCLDFATSRPCAGFGNHGAGLEVMPIDSNGSHDDFPVKIVSDGSTTLFIAGTSSSAPGIGNLDVSVAAIDVDSGTPIAAFGNRSGHPGTVVYGFDRTPNGTDRTTNLLVYSNSSQAGYRVYVVGESQYSADGKDTDGFILALDANSGAKVSGFGGTGVRFIYNDLGQTIKQDVVDAVTMTRDGHLAMAGHSTDDVNNQTMFLAEVDDNGDNVPGFCDGSNCLENALTTYYVPVAIAERGGTRDLVVASTQYEAEGFATARHDYQVVEEFSKSGNVEYATTRVDFPSALPPPDSTASDMLIDFSGYVLLVGSTKSGAEGANDFDMTLTKFIDNDTIFADQF